MCFLFFLRSVRNPVPHPFCVTGVKCVNKPPLIFSHLISLAGSGIQTCFFMHGIQKSAQRCRWAHISRAWNSTPAGRHAILELNAPPERQRHKGSRCLSSKRCTPGSLQAKLPADLVFNKSMQTSLSDTGCAAVKGGTEEESAEFQDGGRRRSASEANMRTDKSFHYGPSLL